MAMLYTGGGIEVSPSSPAAAAATAVPPPSSHTHLLMGGGATSSALRPSLWCHICLGISTDSACQWRRAV